MASLFGKLAGFAKSPQGQKVISQATRKAQELAKDPATRARIDQGAARVRAQVDKRRGGSGRSASPTDPAGPTGPDVTPR